MSSSADLRRAVLLGTAALLLTAGCGTSGKAGEPPDPPLPPGLLVEKSRNDGGWLPPVGLPGGATTLRPRAQAAKNRGLEAADRGDWDAAVAAFEEAHIAAHGSPDIAFNLALAHQKADNPVQAALWYRVWLAMRPGHPDQERISRECTRLIAKAESRALSLFSEAVRMAGLLPDAIKNGGFPGLRQRTLTEMGHYLLSAGLEDRGREVLETAAPPSGSGAGPEKWWDPHGLYAAGWSWDLRRAKSILAANPETYSERAHLYWVYRAACGQGKPSEINAFLLEHPGFRPWVEANKGAYYVNLTSAFEPWETVVRRTFAEVEKGNAYPDDFLQHAYFPVAEEAYWNGRPDVARRTAQLALPLVRRLQEPLAQRHPSPHVILACALLGDTAGIRTELDGGVPGGSRLPLRETGEALGRAALMLLPAVDAAEAAGVIERMIRWYPQAFPNQPAPPLAAFALAMANGEKELPSLGWETPDVAEAQDRMIAALRFCAATGRGKMAIWLSRRIHRSDEVVRALNRLRAYRSLAPDARKDVEDALRECSGGWSPAFHWTTDRVWLAMRQARAFGSARWTSMNSVSASLIADKPDRLPLEIFHVAMNVWLRASAARVDPQPYGPRDDP